MVAEDKRVIIRIKNVSKSYGEMQVLKNVNLDITNGEVLVILGPSGSGKSTLLRTINGLEEIDGGEVFINDELYNSNKIAELSGKKARGSRYGIPAVQPLSSSYGNGKRYPCSKEGKEKKQEGCS